MNEMLLHYDMHSIKDLITTSALVKKVDDVYWLYLNTKEGCKYCNRHAPFLENFNVFESCKNTRIGAKFRHEEDLIADRVLDLIALETHNAQIHDLILPRRMVSNVIRKIYENSQQHVEKLTIDDYIKNSLK